MIFQLIQMNRLIIIIFFFFFTQKIYSQNFGNFPKIEKEKLQRDLNLLYQGLDKYHSGMYWYTPKDSVDFAFQNAHNEISTDLNVLEFHKLIAPLVALSREDHTDVYLPFDIEKEIYRNEQIYFLPLTVVFLGEKLYCLRNGSGNDLFLENLEIESINGETPLEIAAKIGNLFASDGYIKAVKFNDLKGFNFSKYYYYYYGIVDEFVIKFKEVPNAVVLKSLSINQINKNFKKSSITVSNITDSEPLKFKLINQTAYLDIQTFSNEIIKKDSQYKSLKEFLKICFTEIKEKEIKNAILDLSKNGGGTEGNEGLLYSYFGDNYQKYDKVRVKSQKVVLDNGIDKSIKLKTFGFLERVFTNKKMNDGSLERRNNIFLNLMAFSKSPKNKFTCNVFILISPTTYSGASEFSNMMYSQDLAIFIGEETGGGYYGNTSGYSRNLILPNSKIKVEIPALQFMMNVNPKLPFGSGVIPHYLVVPIINQYLNNENAYLDYALKLINE